MIMIKSLAEIACLGILLVSCGTATHSTGNSGGALNPVSVSPSPHEQTNLRSLQVQKLCNSLSEIKVMPIKDETVDDDVYNGLMAAGKEAVPCLIERITDTTKMRDPRKEPHYSDLRVGDAAFFVLLDITKVPFEQMLPEDVRAKIPDQGVYAYFEYVEKAKNRKVLQGRWRGWLERRG
jgi:hypothetical protein